jgi:hypothetical protein
MLTERTDLLSSTRQLLLGSKPSDTSTRTLLTKEVSCWRCKVTSAKKDNLSLLGKSITVRTRDGSSDTVKTTDLINKGKERTAILDSPSTSHSMLSARVAHQK